MPTLEEFFELDKIQATKIYWCRKHAFCPINGTLKHCFAQQAHHGCRNLITLPTEHPRYHSRKYARKKEKELMRRFRRAS